jgi:hypothetical protein
VFELAVDSREAPLGKGARSTSTNAHEVNHIRPGGWSSTLAARRRTEREERHGMVALILDCLPPDRTMHGGFRLQRPYTAPLRSEPRYDFPTQPLPSSVPTINMSASCGVLAWSSRKHTARIRLPRQRKPQGEGAYGRYFTDQPVPKTIGSRPGHDRRDGRSDIRQLIVAIIFSFMPRREVEAYARWKSATGGATNISDECVHGSSRDLRRPWGRFFRLPPPPSPGMTGVAKEPRSSKPDSAIT